MAAAVRHLTTEELSERAGILAEAKRRIRIVLERDGFACVCCGVSVIGRPYGLGLRLRAAHGGRPVPSNLLTLLERCRRRIGSHADPGDEARGYRVESWQDPALIPVMFAGGYRAWLADDGTLVYEAPALAAGAAGRPA